MGKMITLEDQKKIIKGLRLLNPDQVIMKIVGRLICENLPTQQPGYTACLILETMPIQGCKPVKMAISTERGTLMLAREWMENEQEFLTGNRHCSIEDLKAQIIVATLDTQYGDDAGEIIVNAAGDTDIAAKSVIFIETIDNFLERKRESGSERN